MTALTETAVVGSIVGLAVGDALGYPAEFRKREQLLAKIGPAGITDFIALDDPRFARPHFAGSGPPPGTFTDDTQMTIAVAEALLEAGKTGIDELMNAMARHFIAWSRSDENNRAPGNACMAGCRNLAAGVPWPAAGVADSKGCGSAMRVAPIGLYYDDLDKVVEVARASSLLTHGHDAAVEAAAAAALLVALAARGVTPETMYAEIDRRCTPRSPDFARTWRKLPDVIALPPEEVLVQSVLGESWVGEEAVASAMYCFWRHSDDFRRAVLTAVNTDGDSDSIAAITGSIIGARLGLDAIPRTWRERVEKSAYLHELGCRLAKSRNGR